ADFEFTWNALPFADEETQVLFTLLDAGTGDPVYAAQVTGATAEVVAGGTLEPGRAYFASIEFRRTRPSERTRLATGEETTSAGTVTAIEFRTAAVPEPFSLLALSVLAAGLAGWRRGRR
ncbi:MAG: PEP-CTERM sorting domain-containing protein, partial [Planctomycetota bacterium]